LAAAACSADPPAGLEGRYGFDALLFIERSPAAHAGSLVAPDRAPSGARLLWLEPAALGGRLRVAIDVPQGSLLGLDVAADGRRAVVGLRTDAGDRHHLVEVSLDALRDGAPCLTAAGDLGAACRQLTFGPADDTRPVYLPDGRIAFARADPDGPIDFRGRGRARVWWAVAADGSGLVRLDHGPGTALGLRALGDGWLHAVRWTLRNGAVVFLPLRLDPTGARSPAFDGPPAPADRLPLAPQRDAQGRVFAACTPALGTWAAGTVCQRSDQGGYRGIVRDIPAGAGCSPAGRLRHPLPLGEGRFLAAYAKVADGCVSIADGDRGLVPDFALVVLDALGGGRSPVYSRSGRDALWPQPLRRHDALDPGVELPARPDPGCSQDGVRFEGFVDAATREAGAVRLRVMAHLSGALAPFAVELGGGPAGAICRDAAGEQAVAPIADDGSFALRAPSGVGLRLQAVDAYGAAVTADPVWRGGPDCARRGCSACHANDGAPAGFAGSLADQAGPTDLAGPPASRRDFDFRRDIQPILDRSCATAGCHDAETAAGLYVDLDGRLRGLDLHAAAAGRTSVAYRNLLWVDRRRDERGRIVEQVRAYVEPGRARDSRLVQKLGVPCRYDCEQAPAWAPWGLGAAARHPEDQPQFGGTLTDAERWTLVEWIDAGAPFHGRGASP
jgi:hypothetical protein